MTDYSDLIKKAKVRPWFADPGVVSDATVRAVIEIIVQECIDVAARNGDNVDYLKAHFDIE